MKPKVLPYQLKFIHPAGTSRGVLTSKWSYFLFYTESEYTAVGECSPLFGLSPEDPKTYPDVLHSVIQDITYYFEHLDALENWPSIRFGVEMLKRDLKNQDRHILFDSPFVRNEKAIEINGLIWMGDKSTMLEQISKKLNEGWRCLKLKVGAIDFEDELYLLQSIRSRFTCKDLEIRLDANGAFRPLEATEKLKRLSDFDIHSIEQVIAPGQWEAMAKICDQSPIDIALDEELIGVYGHRRKKLIRQIKPSYLIFKPSLLGGWKATESWIQLCAEYQVSWWITSALESNVALSAIAQWAATLNNNMVNGLGTGSLYANNIKSPLKLTPGFLHYDPSVAWDHELVVLKEQ